MLNCNKIITIIIFVFFILYHQALCHQAFQIQSLGQEDPLEKVIATHYSSPIWKIPRTEEPGRDPGVHRVTKIHTQLKQLSPHAHPIRHGIVRMLYYYRNIQCCYQMHFTKYTPEDYFF